MSLKWNGKAVVKKMEKAEVKGISVTMTRAVRHAKKNHTWVNRKGILEGGIGVAVFARRHLTGASGTWGVKDVVYARVHELGSDELNIPARPYLRPAADEKYPDLPGEIRKAFAR